MNPTYKILGLCFALTVAFILCQGIDALKNQGYKKGYEAGYKKGAVKGAGIILDELNHVADSLQINREFEGEELPPDSIMIKVKLSL